MGAVFFIPLRHNWNAMKKQRIIFELRQGDEFIPLIQLLKAAGVVDTGSEAQEVVTAGLVLRNGEVETRKRAKIITGEIIQLQNIEIEVK